MIWVPMLGTHPGVLLLGAPAIGSEPCHYAHDLNPEIPIASTVLSLHAGNNLVLANPP